MKKTNNKKGFTLIEVLIGIMILTIAIVSGSNLVVTLTSTNKNIAEHLKAYYLAQEGIEAVRNIRDSNWLQNVDFLGDGGVFPPLEPGNTYAISLRSAGWSNSDFRTDLMKNYLVANYLPWDVSSGMNVELVEPFHSIYALEEAGFYRHIDILNPCEEGKEMDEDDCSEFVLVRSEVDFDEDESVILEAILTNWKGGAL